MLGDAIHNLRSALDHLVYAIGVHESKGQLSAQKRKQSSFVICNNPNDLKSKYWHIAPLSVGVRTAIEGVQPYVRPLATMPPLLAVLRDLDDADKHRLLTVVLSQPTRAAFRNVRNLIPEQKVELVIHSGSLEDGTELGAIALDRPTANVKYDFDVMAGRNSGSARRWA